MSRLRRLVVVAAVAIVAATTLGDDGLIAASSDDHLWLIMAGREADSRHLMHHARRMDGPYIASQRKLNSPPEHLAAWSDRVWIVMPPTDGRRDVFTLQAQHNPALDAYLTVPTDRLEVAAPLPAEGEVAAIFGTELGPVALLTGSTTQLLRLESATWQPLPLPDDIDLGRGGHLVPPGADPHALQLLTPGGRGRAIVHQRHADGSWTRSERPLDADAVVSAGRIEDHPFVVRHDGADVHIDYLRSRPLPLTRFPIPGTAAGETPGGDWVVLGLADGPRIVRRSAGSALLMQRIDPGDGTVGPAEEMIRPPLPANQVWHLSLLLAVAVTLGLIAIVFRPGSRSPVALPPDSAAVSPFTRALGLAIDLLPGAVVAVAFYGAMPAELIRAPLFAPDLADSTAYILMAGVAFGHCVILETITGRSLGKMLMGGRVVGADGQPVSRLRLILRNLLKLLVLILPPLAILCLLNPHLQGVHDLMARTVVVGPVEPDEAAGSGTKPDR